MMSFRQLWSAAFLVTFLLAVSSAWSQAPEFIGCFRDQGDTFSTNGRDLNGYMFNARNMTGAVCRAECAKRGLAYAGTQYSSRCFCGNQYGRSGLAPNCDMACAGNNREMCGGAWANSVYRTVALVQP